MLTGKRAFPGEDVTDTLAAVVRAEPDWSLVPGNVSPTLLVFLRRSLQKDPKQRVPDIRDVRLALEGAFETAAPQTTAAATSPAPRGRLAWIVAAAAVLVAAALAIPAVRHLREAPPEEPSLQLSVPLPANSQRGFLEMSPDGRPAVGRSISGRQEPAIPPNAQFAGVDSRCREPTMRERPSGRRTAVSSLSSPTAPSK